MLSHDDILIALRQQIDNKSVRQTDVARKLNIAPARVAEMRKGQRRIQPQEMQLLAEFLGLSENRTSHPKQVEETLQIRNLGKVAQGVWLEQSFADPEEPEYVHYDRMKGDPGAENLFAVTPEGKSMNLLFPPGMRLICRYIPFGFDELRNGDLVIVERASHDLREMTCKELRVDDEGVYWLHSKSDQSAFQTPLQLGKPSHELHIDNEIRVIGKVLRGVVVYDN